MRAIARVRQVGDKIRKAMTRWFGHVKRWNSGCIGWCDRVGCGRWGELDESKEGDVKTYTKPVLTNR